jgi:enoyl-CoA hydratase/carnithine racemase
MQDVVSHNSMSREMIRALGQAFRQAEADPQVKVIVLESAVPKVFSPGVAVSAFMEEQKQLSRRADRLLPFLPKSWRRTMAGVWQLPALRRFALEGYALHQRIAASSKVTVARVQGPAVGGGMELALACDYILATPEARFALPEVKFGIYPDWGATERLPQRIGKAMARFVILAGGLMGEKGLMGPATLSAEEAKTLGLVDAVVSEAAWEAVPSIQSLVKSQRPQDADALEALEQKVSERVVGTRFSVAYQRYRTASVEELLAQDLKGLYPPTVRLADRRIAAAPHVSRWTVETDLLRMLTYFAAVMGRRKSG